MNNLKEDCQKINNWFVQNTIQYEIPFIFTQPYKNDIAYLSILSINIGLITSRPLLQQYDEIKLYYQQGKEREKKYKIITFNSLNKQISFDDIAFQIVFEYNIKLQMGFYSLSPKNYSVHAINSHSFRFEGKYRNYLFVPINYNCYDQIDYNFMQKFNEQREINFNRYQEKCLKNMDSSKEQINQELFYFPKTQLINCLYTVVSNPEQLTVKEYLIRLIKFSLFELEDIIEYYNLEDEVLEKSVAFFLYDYQFRVKTDRIQAILHLRSIRDKIGSTSTPLAIMKQVTNILKIQYFTEDQQQNLDCFTKYQKHFSCKPYLEISNPNVQILPTDRLYHYDLNVIQYDNYLVLPFFMLQLEQQQIISEFACSLKMTPSLTVQKAISRPSYHRELNYETLETLGDSILKFCSTISVSLGSQNVTDCQLTEQRSQMINNMFLAKHLFDHEYFGLFKFIRSLNHQSKWTSPVLQNIHSNHLQPESLIKPEAKLMSQFIADIFESLIGAIFLDKQSLLDVFQFLSDIKHPSCLHPIIPIFFPSFSIVLQYSKLNLNNMMTFQQLAPNFQIQYDQLKSIQQQYDDRFIQLQKYIIEYEFKNIFILQEAFNIVGYNLDIELPLQNYYSFLYNQNLHSPRVQSLLELIGDAILECFIVTNCFNQLIFKFQPMHLYKIKMILLSNSFLAKIAIVCQLNYFIKDPLLQQYIKQVNLNERFTHYNGNFVKVPKVLSDTFEALIGAIFMDGGWEPILKFLRKIYNKFIPFVCNFLNEIDDHVIERVSWYSTQNQGYVDIKQFKLENGQHCCEIRIDNLIIGRYCHEHEIVAKERACESACKRLKI